MALQRTGDLHPLTSPSNRTRGADRRQQPLLKALFLCGEISESRREDVGSKLKTLARRKKTKEGMSSAGNCSREEEEACNLRRNKSRRQLQFK